MDYEVLALENFLGPGVKVIRDYDSNIIVNGDIFISVNDNTFNQMPVKIYILNGNLNWHGEGSNLNNLVSLKNFPTIVNGDVNIYGNKKLTSLEFCPRVIKGNLVCDRCMLTSFKGISESIGKNLIASFNPIKDITDLDKVEIGGIISLVNIDPKIINEAKKTVDSSIIVEQMSLYESYKV